MAYSECSVSIAIVICYQKTSALPQFSVNGIIIVPDIKNTVICQPHFPVHFSFGKLFTLFAGSFIYLIYSF